MSYTPFRAIQEAPVSKFARYTSTRALDAQLIVEELETHLSPDIIAVRDQGTPEIGRYFHS